MKKCLTTLVILFALAGACVLQAKVGPCKDGNMWFENDTASWEDDLCCKPVGDGTVLSCTDGGDWFLVYPL